MERWLTDGATYDVDGLVDGTVDKRTTISNMDDEGTSYSPFKFTSTCIDDESSDWLSSYGDVNRYDFLATRPIQMSGFCSYRGRICEELPEQRNLFGRL